MKKLICNALVCSSLFFVQCGGADGQNGSGGQNGSNGQNGTDGTGGTGSAGPQGPKGDPGMDAAANLTLLTPGVGFPGRTLQVRIAAVATMLMTSAPTVDFGDPAITVTNTTVLSDASVLITIDIAPTAKMGAHNVTLISGGQTLKLMSGFTVRPSLTAEPLPTAPTAVQGGFVAFNLRNQDYVTHPFARVSGQEIFSGTGLYLPPDNVGYELISGSISNNSLAAALLVDPLAAVGPAVPTIQGHDAFGSPLGYYADPADPSLPQISARVPAAVTLGTPLTAQSFAKTGDTKLYSFNNDTANLESLPALHTV